MKTIIILLSLMISIVAKADPMLDQAKAHLKVLDEKNREMAQYLVIATYMDVIHRGKTPNLSITHSDLKKVIQQTQDNLLNISLDEGDKTENVKAITNNFIATEVAMQKWMNDRAAFGESSIDFRNNIVDTKELCTDEQFSRSMALAQLKENDGLDFSKLKGRFEISIQGRYDLGGQDSNLERSDGPSGGNIEDAAAFTAAAAASMAVNAALAKGATLAAADLAAMTVPGLGAAVAAYVAVKLVAAYMKAKKAEKALKELYAMNEKIFESMKLEFNVKKYYQGYCKAVQKAYVESRSNILQFNEGKKTVSEIQTLVTQYEEKLKAKNIDPANPPMNSSDEDVTDYFNYRIYERALSLHTDSDFVRAKSARAFNEFTDIRKNTYDTIRGVFLSSIKVAYTGQESAFIERLKNNKETEMFRKSFTELALKVIDLVDPIQKSLKITEMENLFSYFKLTRLVPSAEEKNMILSYEGIIADLKETL